MPTHSVSRKPVVTSLEDPAIEQSSQGVRARGAVTQTTEAGLLNRRTMLVYLVPLGAVLTLFGLIVVFSEGKRRDFLVQEGGVVESATVLGYFLCLCLLLFKGGLSRFKSYADVFVLISFFMLRELDFDKKFTTMGIFKSRFYTSAEVPGVEKLIGVFVILILVSVVCSILYRHLKTFLTGLKNREAFFLGPMIVFALLVLSKSMDGIARRLKSLGLELDKQARLNFQALEETLELGIPVLLMVTAIQYFAYRKSRLNVGNKSTVSD